MAASALDRTESGAPLWRIDASARQGKSAHEVRIFDRGHAALDALCAEHVERSAHAPRPGMLARVWRANQTSLA